MATSIRDIVRRERWAANLAGQQEAEAAYHAYHPDVADAATYALPVGWAGVIEDAWRSAREDWERRALAWWEERAS